MSAHPHPSRQDPQTEIEPYDLVLTFRNHRLVIKNRYEMASISNDMLIAIAFLAGSIFSFFSSYQLIGTWLYIFGSVQLVVRPCIRIARRMHLQRIQDEKTVQWEQRSESSEAQDVS
ncbi:YrhK family protein [Marinicrinis sediminis]|uniref:YrhK family protein n=1 Tax=Marinicrinis sediminis TaxID=1652465 RepID=A0ABW5REI0_9BACL